MTLTGLRYFVALAELRNFSRVAEQYYVAQAAVTYQIKNMEKELGVKLFERSTRSVKLTPAGHNFYMDVAPLLKQLGACLQKSKDAWGKKDVYHRIFQDLFWQCIQKVIGLSGPRPHNH